MRYYIGFGRMHVARPSILARRTSDSMDIERAFTTRETLEWEWIAFESCEEARRVHSIARAVADKMGYPAPWLMSRTEVVKTWPFLVEEEGCTL